MKQGIKWPQWMFIIGVIAFLIGTLDPMEGSVVIAAGSILMAIGSLLKYDRQSIVFTATAIMIFTGVFCLWYVSSLGGFDPKKEWWWIVLILPYPIGWLINVGALIVRAFRSRKHTLST